MQAAKRTLGSEQHASSKPLAFGDKSEFARDLTPTSRSSPLLGQCLLASAGSLRRVVLDGYGMRPKAKSWRPVALAASSSAMLTPVLKPSACGQELSYHEHVSNKLLSPRKKSRRADSNR